MTLNDLSNFTNISQDFTVIKVNYIIIYFLLCILYEKFYEIKYKDDIIIIGRLI